MTNLSNTWRGLKKDKGLYKTNPSPTWKNIKKDKVLYLMLMPGIMCFIIFKYIPMFGLTIAFQNYSPILGFFKSPWAMSSS